MILLIDNYDSFSYNLYQLIGQVNDDIEVYRNDKITPDEIEDLNPEAIILSPGPGRPEDAGICVDTVKKFHDKIPILGVCLGHQAICVAFGGKISYASKLMHGKSSIAKLNKDPIFKGLNDEITVGRYHSLSLVETTLPKDLRIISKTADNGEIMAVKHEKYDIYGLQFHPESILTPDGITIIENFINKIIREDN
ncbi:MAG: aminodeoxychorismate/anthranilate synthase component II [Methanobrevibacter smithii]|jgi:anthranilate synthase component 2|uniref:anthranilate synthase component II n=1 Tax=Methanobrevibacter TaxID=2172 RepID=UPI002026030E|nr:MULTISPECIES: aminodeoxychorismate/anthranilate synthase component II [Methanobrevibacter]URN48799.1 aminodeoxychorismate/anthranilate synthase component II [Methanobrevibacter sp. TLL-48-HuF1]